jgi:glycerophosphoryl diester phosphodiesterase
MLKVPEDLDIQGHRGARGLEPENTLPSFEKALDLEVDTLELDLHLSKGGEVVVWHDAHIEAEKCRWTGPEQDAIEPAAKGEESPETMIRNLTIEQLANFQCDLNPDPERFPEQNAEPTALAGSNYGITTLDALFSFVEVYSRGPDKSASQRENAATIRFNIETKRKSEHPEYIGDGFDGESPGAFEKEIVRLVQKHELEDRVTLQSFEHDSLWAARAIAPDMQLAALEGERRRPLSYYAERGAAVWSPRSSLVTSETVQEARNAGLQVIPWTVNEVDEMKRLVDLGVDGIISDRPDLLVEARTTGR